MSGTWILYGDDTLMCSDDEVAISEFTLEIIRLGNDHLLELSLLKAFVCCAIVGTLVIYVQLAMSM